MNDYFVEGSRGVFMELEGSRVKPFLNHAVPSAVENSISDALMI